MPPPTCTHTQYHFFSCRLGVVFLVSYHPCTRWPDQNSTAPAQSSWLRQAFETSALSKVTDSCWKQRLQQEIGFPSPFWQVGEQRKEAAGLMRKNPVFWASFSQSSVRKKIQLENGDFRLRLQRIGGIVKNLDTSALCVHAPFIPDRCSHAVRPGRVRRIACLVSI